jgi:hypothetical protein
MPRQFRRTWQQRARSLWAPVACLLLLVAALEAGCKSNAHTSDPKLRQIDELLEAQLPSGTPKSRVEFLLNARGYKIEDSPEANTVVTVIRNIDTITLQPVTARVTFHFDANQKLITYRLQSVPNAPLPP